jgi:diguanylate cyclase (GGDEF)-like protein
MVDVDHFRRINSLHGHQEGDRVLAELSRTLKAGLRQIDIIGRYGGEGFLIVLPNTPFAETEIIAERLRKSVEEMDVELISNRVTISIGIAEFIEDDTALKLIDRADGRLYEAKRAGRNRVS